MFGNCIDVVVVVMFSFFPFHTSTQAAWSHYESAPNNVVFHNTSAKWQTVLVRKLTAKKKSSLTLEWQVKEDYQTNLWPLEISASKEKVELFEERKGPTHKNYIFQLNIGINRDTEETRSCVNRKGFRLGTT